MMGPYAVPFLRSMLAAKGLMDREWGERAQVVLSFFEIPAAELHPATVAALASGAPHLIEADPDALDDPSTPVFAGVASPPRPEPVSQ